jgi:hypothetical protein
LFAFGFIIHTFILMKKIILVSPLVLFIACTQADAVYEGPVANNLCALEVFPVKKSKSPDSFILSADSFAKKDPLVRQEGLMVCRSY